MTQSEEFVNLMRGLPSLVVSERREVAEWLWAVHKGYYPKPLLIVVNRKEYAERLYTILKDKTFGVTYKELRAQKSPDSDPIVIGFVLTTNRKVTKIELMGLHIIMRIAAEIETERLDELADRRKYALAHRATTSVMSLPVASAA